MRKYLIMAVTLISLVACKDSYEVIVPNFEVSTARAVYAVGETVQFSIEGSPDMINFYSGSIGNDINFREQDRIYAITPKLSFRAAKFAGNNQDCAELLYSTDFNGNYEFAQVKATNWKNISSLFAIPPIVGTAATFSNAGTANIANLIEAGKPIYFAWYCKTNEGSERTRFQAVDFNILGEVAGNSSLSGIIYTQAQVGFKWVLNEAAAAQVSNKPSITNTTVYWDGIFNNLTGPLKEGYAVSGPIILSNKMNLGLDKPKVIKSIQNENVSKYAYTFDKPGEYEVAFVGYNVNYNGKKEVVKKIKLTIN